MRNRKVACLLILLFFSIIYGIKLIVDAKSHPKIVFTDLPGLIRTGYDFVDDSHAFPKLCTLLNDSLLLKKGGVKMAVLLILICQIVQSTGVCRTITMKLNC